MDGNLFIKEDGSSITLNKSDHRFVTIPSSGTNQGNAALNLFSDLIKIPGVAEVMAKHGLEWDLSDVEIRCPKCNSSKVVGNPNKSDMYLCAVCFPDSKPFDENGKEIFEY